MVRKPKGVSETESLLRVLAKVPKHELDARLAKSAAKKPTKRAKRRKK